MPNWATNHLSISGDEKLVAELVSQVATPYETEHLDYESKSLKLVTKTGDFLLWNCIRPIDMDTYYGRSEYEETLAKWNEPKPSTKDVTDNILKAVEKMTTDMTSPEFDVAESIARMNEDIATKQDWYNWNIRNWGTKWDISDDSAEVMERRNGFVKYYFSTAWSCPAEALDNLAKQYPTLSFTLVSIDESDLWALEMGWGKGDRSYEIELPITHTLKMALHGECWACSPANDDIDPKYREEMGCNLESEIDLFLSTINTEDK
jgi:hypothetical protein